MCSTWWISWMRVTAIRYAWCWQPIKINSHGTVSIYRPPASMEKSACLYLGGIYCSFVAALFHLHQYPAGRTEEILSGGIEINYGTSEYGMGTDYTSVEAVS